MSLASEVDKMQAKAIKQEEEKCDVSALNKIMSVCKGPEQTSESEAHTFNFFNIPTINESEVEDTPIVFFCTKCRLPVGDSTSWMGSDEPENTIFLKSVTKYAVMGKEHKFSQESQYGCIYVNLICSGCSLELGRVYICTPRQLDFKRDLYCLNITSLDSYVIGSTQGEISEDVPICTETRRYIEGEMEKTKAVVEIMEKKVTALEAKLKILAYQSLETEK
ncbi:protein Mis18-alpha [Protopterus annectens]|uniref:protein Mis18-alpha n=1 Tax=Protopterus annectens TaxID=7888 RepID=UPI001CF9BF7A|nr:protein Mis18-alpha [Protopterus annectens]